MYSIAVSTILGTLVGMLVSLRYNMYAALFTGFFVVVLAFFLLSRHFVGRLQKVQTNAMKHLEELQGNPSPAKQKIKFDLAIKTLKEGYGLDRWMVFGKSQIEGQIGTIFYLRKDFDAAYPYLKASFSRNWVAQAMLASIYYRRHEYAKMEEVMDKVIKQNKKEAFVWGLYAWFEEMAGKKDRALDLMGQAAETLPDNEWIKKTLLNLQNKKKIKMSKFNEMWYQLHLESPPRQLLQQQANMQKFSAFRRGKMR